MESFPTELLIKLKVSNDIIITTTKIQYYFSFQIVGKFLLLFTVFPNVGQKFYNIFEQVYHDTEVVQDWKHLYGWYITLCALWNSGRLMCNII